NDELGEQRIEITGDRLSAPQGVLEAQIGRARRLQHRQRSGLRQKVALGILGADAAFDRMAAPRRRPRYVAEAEAGDDLQLQAHEIEAGYLLGHRMLDLKPGVHLQEEEP